MTAELIHLYQRDINRLKEEIESFESEENLWQTSGKITNAAGNLALHLAGNLNHFVGEHMGNTGYIRNREDEFGGRVSQKELVQLIEATGEMLGKVLGSMQADQLEAIHPLQPFGYEMTNRYFLIHLFGHLSYHLGQINYLRRFLEK